MEQRMLSKREENLMSNKVFTSINRFGGVFKTGAHFFSSSQSI